MGAILNVEPTSKGLVRSAVVRTETTELRRPLLKHALLLAVEDLVDAEDSSNDADKRLV